MHIYKEIVAGWRLFGLFACSFLLSSPPVRAEGKGFFSQHNLGVSYAVSTSSAEIGYDAPAQPTMPENCEKSASSSDQIHCTAYLSRETSSSPEISVFIEAPFKRTGLFYFEPGLTFSTVSYNGTLSAKPAPVSTGGRKDRGSAPDQPLTRAYMDLYGVNWQGYLRFGLTPRYVPDLFISLGLGVQTVGGTIKVFKQSYNRFVAQPEGFAEAELVLLRLASGSLSVFVGQDQSLYSQIGTKLIEDHPDGTELTNFHLGLVGASSGVRLLFPF